MGLDLKNAVRQRIVGPSISGMADDYLWFDSTICLVLICLFVVETSLKHLVTRHLRYRQYFCDRGATQLGSSGYEGVM